MCVSKLPGHNESARCVNVLQVQLWQELLLQGAQQLHELDCAAAAGGLSQRWPMGPMGESHMQLQVPLSVLTKSTAELTESLSGPDDAH